MLKYINNLHPFFEDCYRRINVREYSRLIGISPPTASKLLSEYHKEGILDMENERNYLLFHAAQSKLFIDLSRIYWHNKLKNLLNYLSENSLNSPIILFGSLSKGEAKNDSDIDIAIFSKELKFDLFKFEKKLGRKIQIFFVETVENELLNNIINGYILRGRIKWIGKNAVKKE